VTFDHHTPHAKYLDRKSLAEYVHSFTDADPWVRNAIETAYVAEFGSDSDRQSSLNLLTMLETDGKSFALYGDGDESMRIHGGGSTLVEASRGGIVTRASELNHRLLKIEERATGLNLTFQNGGATKTVRARG